MLEEQDFKKIREEIGEVIKENTEVNNKKLREEVAIMFETNNIKIGEVMEEKIKTNNIKIGEEVGKVIEQNIIPVLDAMNKEIAGIKEEITGIKAVMVTKSYLDDKMADLEGSVITRQKKEDKRFNLLVEFLQKKQILGETEIKMLRDFQIFPEMNLN